MTDIQSGNVAVQRKQKHQPPHWKDTRCKLRGNTASNLQGRVLKAGMNISELHTSSYLALCLTVSLTDYTVHIHDIIVC